MSVEPTHHNPRVQRCRSLLLEAAGGVHLGCREILAIHHVFIAGVWNDADSFGPVQLARAGVFAIALVIRVSSPSWRRETIRWP